MSEVGDDELEALAVVFGVTVEQMTTFLTKVEIRFQFCEDGTNSACILKGAMFMTSYEVEKFESDPAEENIIRKNYYWNPMFLHLLRNGEVPREQWAEFGSTLLVRGKIE